MEPTEAETYYGATDLSVDSMETVTGIDTSEDNAYTLNDIY